MNEGREASDVQASCAGRCRGCRSSGLQNLNICMRVLLGDLRVRLSFSHSLQNFRRPATAASSYYPTPFATAVIGAGPALLSAASSRVKDHAGSSNHEEWRHWGSAAASHLTDVVPGFTRTTRALTSSDTARSRLQPRLQGYGCIEGQRHVFIPRVLKSCVGFEDLTSCAPHRIGHFHFCSSTGHTCRKKQDRGPFLPENSTRLETQSLRSASCPRPLCSLSYGTHSHQTKCVCLCRLVESQQFIWDASPTQSLVRSSIVIVHGSWST